MTALHTQIIGLGQDTAGDDGIGIAVARHLRQMKLPEGVEVIERAEPSGIIKELSDAPRCVVLVDAIVDGGRPGRVLEIDPSHPASNGARPLSTHGIGLLEAIDIARVLNGAAMPHRIAIVGITIEQPKKYEAKLSDPLAAAIVPAAELALKLAAGDARSGAGEANPECCARDCSRARRPAHRAGARMDCRC